MSFIPVHWEAEKGQVKQIIKPQGKEIIKEH
jgi:hypothetical protein